ncbi:serine hydrolase [Vibrio sp. 404]|uniref:Serine hydrolase n=1 Tax=Vibrio marinisediminis TaxID=2758441 RepID=A0A7W2FQQ9_9VIBR|nr:serine hydrolase [Vibrio marinisediminis]MBA5762539.1 serine hydrolase [Vibrio marinisediminis]
MTSLTRRNVLKAGVAVGCAGVGLTVGYDLLKDPLVKLDEDLNRALQDLPAASISAAIIKNNQLYWHKNYGFEDLDSKRKMTEESAWQTIGSISKLVVWTALMQLVERGDLDLHRDVSDYLGFKLRSPYYPQTSITTYHLMTHSSSLSSRKLMSKPYPMADSFCQNQDQTLAQWVEQYLNPSSESFSDVMVFDEYEAGDFANVSQDPLGVVSGYSNLNAVVGAYLVERITDQKFNAYCEDAIFEPCAMKQTSWSKDKPLHWMTHYEAEYSPRAPIMQVYTKAMIDQGYTGEAFSFMPDGRKFLNFSNCDYFSPVYPMGLLGTSMQSLLPFFLAFVNQGRVNDVAILQPESVAKILSIQRRDKSLGTHLGLGWFRKQDAYGNQLWGHDGGGPGVVSSAYVNPAKGSGVLLFINNFHVSYSLREKLLAAMNKIAHSV